MGEEPGPKLELVFATPFRTVGLMSAQKQLVIHRRGDINQAVYPLKRSLPHYQTNPAKCPIVAVPLTRTPERMS